MIVPVVPGTAQTMEQSPWSAYRLKRPKQINDWKKEKSLQGMKSHKEEMGYKADQVH